MVSMNAVTLAVLFGVVVATGMYYSLRVATTYDKQLGLDKVPRRRTVYFSIAIGLAVAVVTFLVAR
jgi:hypothetical protein